jgi:hypothetical protein
VCLKVPGLCLVEDLTDVVDRALYGPDPYGWPQVLKVYGDRTTTFSWGNLLTPLGMLRRPFDDQHHAHHLCCRCNVQVQRLPDSRATRIGRDTRCCFNSWKARYASLVQEKGPDFHRSLKKGSTLSASREMKRLGAARDPVSF